MYEVSVTQLTGLRQKFAFINGRNFKFVWWFNNFTSLQIPKISCSYFKLAQLM